MGESKGQTEVIYELVFEWKVEERNIPKIVVVIITTSRKEQQRYGFKWKDRLVAH